MTDGRGAAGADSAGRPGRGTGMYLYFGETIFDVESIPGKTHMAQIRDVLPERNPWWTGPFSPEFKERELHRELDKYMALPQMIALTGLRRVGKTTLMLKLADDWMRAGNDPQSVLYFSFDEHRDASLRELVRAYEEEARADLSSGRHLLLLDEVQKLRGWEDQLKALYDTHKGRAKVVVSGSESLFIRKGSRESLAGRMFDFRMEPLTFREYLAFTRVEPAPVAPPERMLAAALDGLVLTQGFPELVGVADRDIVRKYLREGIVEKAVYRDIPSIYNVRDASALESLLDIIMEEPGQLVRLDELSGTLGLSRPTLSSYLSYLEGSFLVRKLYNYSRNRRKAERKLKKYYPTIASVDLLSRGDEASRARAFEWLLANQLRAEFFWRDPYRNEVDLVVEGASGPLPIEVKSGRPGFAGLVAFMRRFGVDRGIVASPDREDEREVDGGRVRVVPAYRLLLEGVPGRGEGVA